jgi:hypothetical protein
MKTIVFVVAVMLASVVWAQDAKVIELTPADAVKAEQVYQAKQKADQAWKDEQKELAERYTVVDEKDSDASNTLVDSIFGTVSGVASIQPPCFAGTSDPNYKCPDTIGTNCHQEATNPPGQTVCGPTETPAPSKPFVHYYRQGWQNGFDFSKDFRFIVPKPDEAPKNTCPPNVMW